ncbi:response regulator [Aeromonas dhakensis]|uniref:response regulator transcription factor n=1 Tax=Aeromonas hydrophila TaxID=644 RepID=UPI0029D467EE|nr:response regulator transcription factor [Aeromonas hydrophila]MDX7780541.1 response regulator transcription factor [Aeromonas hydrophila]
MAKILVVDDHPAIRMAVSMLLAQDEHVVCAEVDNGVEAIQQCKKYQPDIVILDIGIPKLDGIEVIKRLKDIDTSTQVIVLTAQSGSHMMIRSYQSGADGFVSKLDDLNILKDAIKSCLKGRKFFPTNIVFASERSVNVDDKNIIDTLSDREMTVFLAMCQGKTNKDIATDMLLSEKTVSTYKTRLMQKLQVENVVELIELAKRCMII